MVQGLVESYADAVAIPSNTVDHGGNTVLHSACRFGHTSIVEYLVNSGRIDVDVNIQNKEGFTPFHFACQFGHMGVVEFLVESNGIDVNANIQANNGWTPLYLACWTEHMAVVEYVMESDRIDADINIKGSDGLTALHVACWHGNRDLVAYLMESGQVRVTMESNRGYTLIYYTCWNKRPDVLEYLVQSNHIDVDAYINKQNDQGDTPLHAACAFGGIDLLRYVMESDEIGVDINVNVRNDMGDTSLQLAFRRKEQEIIAYLLEWDWLSFRPEAMRPNRDGDSLLHVVCEGGTRDAIASLMESHYIDVNSMLGIDGNGNGSMRNSKGDTPLHTALSSCTEVGAVEYLMNYDRILTSIQLHTQNNDGNTPFHIACGNPSFSWHVFWCLKDCNLLNINHNTNVNGINANVDKDDIFNIQNKHGNTPLHIACLKGDDYFIQHLLLSCKVNASLNIQNKDGDTPLHIAFNRGMFFTINHAARLRHVFDFIQRQVVPTANLSVLNIKHDGGGSDGGGDTVGAMRIIQQLMENATAIANIQNHDGTTLLHLACKKGDVSVLRNLIGCDSVDATLRNSKGDTALHCVCIFRGADGEPSENGKESDDGKMRVAKMETLVKSPNVNVDVNMTDGEGDTVLHRAVKAGCLEVVKYLVTLNTTDRHARGKHGLTPLQCAKRGHCAWKMLAALMSKPVDRAIEYDRLRSW